MELKYNPGHTPLSIIAFTMSSSLRCKWCYNFGETGYMYICENPMIVSGNRSIGYHVCVPCMFSACVRPNIDEICHGLYNVHLPKLIIESTNITKSLVDIITRYL
jgi:hypothetical protein